MTAHWALTRGFMGVLASGEEVAFEVVDINRFGADRKYVEHWSVVDLLTLLKQLGAVPSPAGAASEAACHEGRGPLPTNCGSA